MRDLLDIAKTLLLLRLIRGAHVKIKYNHHNSPKITYYPGTIKKIVKKYKIGIIVHIHFEDGTRKNVSLPYIEHLKTWIIL